MRTRSKTNAVAAPTQTGRAALSLLLAALCGGSVHAAITLEQTNFISSPTDFNGFEAIGSSPAYNQGLLYPTNRDYSEGGITVRYVGSDNAGGLVTGPGFGGLFPGAQGSFGWYPNGGGVGYTKITLTDGGGFSAVQFLAGSGSVGDQILAYQLLKGGSVVDSGLANVGNPLVYVGFSGGGFDEVDIQVNPSALQPPFGPTNGDVLALDSIGALAAPVPEPATWALMGLSAAFLGLVTRRRRQHIAAEQMQSTAIADL